MNAMSVGRKTISRTREIFQIMSVIVLTIVGFFLVLFAHSSRTQKLEQSLGAAGIAHADVPVSGDSGGSGGSGDSGSASGSGCGSAGDCGSGGAGADGAGGGGDGE